LSSIFTFSKKLAGCALRDIAPVIRRFFVLIYLKFFEALVVIPVEIGFNTGNLIM